MLTQAQLGWPKEGKQAAGAGLDGSGQGILQKGGEEREWETAWSLQWPGPAPSSLLW